MCLKKINNNKAVSFANKFHIKLTKHISKMISICKTIFKAN